jgi:uncharacterized protein with PQ loop repeat
MLHHIQKHKTAKKDPLDYLLYFFVFTTPLFEIPQAVAIYRNQSAANVSSLTWAYFLITNVVWLIYGIRRKLWPVVLSYSLYMAVEAVIVVGIVRYS